MKNKSTKSKLRVLGVGAVIISAFFIGKFAMAGIFGTHTLFSEVVGTVVVNGEPIEGAVVKQNVSRGHREAFTQTTETGPDGSFQFDEVSSSKKLLDFLPGEMVVQQEIEIIHDDQMFQGWIFTKRDGLTGSESDGERFKLVCDIAREPDFDGKYFGICRLI